MVEKTYSIGDMVDVDGMNAKDISRFFCKRDLDKKLLGRIEGNSYRENDRICHTDLQYITVLHYDFRNYIRLGELIAHRRIADDLIDIFKELLQGKYQIERVRLIDDYQGNDDRSMAANNSSCFNFRFIKGTETMSNHSMGCAVDINPLYNPYIHIMEGTTVCDPPAGKEFIDRSADFPHKIDKDDLCCRIFKKYGFEWGGDWSHAKDYQHFQKVL